MSVRAHAACFFFFHPFTHAQTHRHTDTQTHRHTDTHTDTQTHTYPSPPRSSWPGSFAQLAHDTPPGPETASKAHPDELDEQRVQGLGGGERSRLLQHPRRWVECRPHVPPLLQIRGHPAHARHEQWGLGGCQMQGREAHTHTHTHTHIHIHTRVCWYLPRQRREWLQWGHRCVWSTRCGC